MTPFPVLESVEVRMWAIVEVVQRAGGDEGFAAAFPAGEQERDIGDLFGEDVDRAIDPDDLLIGVGKRGTGVVDIFATKPGL